MVNGFQVQVIRIMKQNLIMNTMDDLIFDTDLDLNTSSGGTEYGKSSACARFFIFSPPTRGI